MKAHSDTLTRDDFYAAANTPVYTPDVIERGSRSRARGFDFRLNGSSNRWRNSGHYGAESVRAATWDQHGEWFARLFDIDPDAIIGPYDGRDDFHAQTDDKYNNAKHVANAVGPASS